MIENSGINNNKSEFDLYNFLFLLWKYKVLISLIPAIVLVISLFLFKNNTSHLTYKNEIFIDYQTMSGVSQYADTSAPDIMTLLVQACREKHNFFKFIEDNPQKEIIKNMINGKRLKCKYDSQENRIYIIVENYLVKDQTQIEDLAYFPFIFFNFIEENINEKITRYYESKIEFRKNSIEKKLNDTKTQINIQRSTIKDEYKSAISQLKMHLHL